MSRSPKLPLPQVTHGAIAGLLASWPLANAIVPTIYGMSLSVLAGITFAAALRSRRQSVAENALAASTLGVAAWVFVHVITLPLLSGNTPAFDAKTLADLFPELAAWMIFGSIFGLVFSSLERLTKESASKPPEAPPKVRARIVILGGGFAGVSCAQELERLFVSDSSIRIQIVSDTNSLLFTPMLAEVAGGALEPTHISCPLRTALKRTEVVRGRVLSVDRGQQCVHVSDPNGETLLPYDHLVLALGAVSNFFGSTNVQRHAFEFKTLGDAASLRNRVIECFERADKTTDPAERRRLTTFVVAGGGFAGAELAGALNDFSRGMVSWYPNIDPADVRVVLVHARDRILPELSEDLALYAQERMTARGVTFRLNAKVADAQPSEVILAPAETIAAETLVWTAGTAPHPILKTLGVPVDSRGAVMVDGSMRVASAPRIWAAGDAAHLVNGHDGKPCPPTAQFALREGRALARNLHAAIHGRALRSFAFESLGALCVVGHHTACAELTVPWSGGRRLRFSGFIAWWLWRTIYLMKLPGLERKLRVISDWTIELFFPRDIVQTLQSEAPRPSDSQRPVALKTVEAAP